MFRRQKLSDNIQNMFWPIRLQSMLDDTISDLIYYRLLNFAKKLCLCVVLINSMEMRPFFVSPLIMSSCMIPFSENTVTC